MMFFKKLAAISAVYCGLSYIAGMFVYLYILQYNNATTAAAQIDITSSKAVLMHITTLHTYVLFSFAIILIATYLYLKLKDQQQALGLLSLIIGIIWSTILIASGFISMTVTSMFMSGAEITGLENAWQALDIIKNALGGGNELIGGVFTGLLSLAMYKARFSSMLTSGLGAIVFVGGFISSLPYLAEVGIGIFVISQILWFFSLGYDINKNE